MGQVRTVILQWSEKEFSMTADPDEDGGFLCSDFGFAN